jgi:hypothetical protein
MEKRWPFQSPSESKADPGVPPRPNLSPDTTQGPPGHPAACSLCFLPSIPRLSSHRVGSDSSSWMKQAAAVTNCPSQIMNPAQWQPWVSRDHLLAFQRCFLRRRSNDNSEQMPTSQAQCACLEVQGIQQHVRLGSQFRRMKTFWRWIMATVTQH